MKKRKKAKIENLNIRLGGLPTSKAFSKTVRAFQEISQNLEPIEDFPCSGLHISWSGKEYSRKKLRDLIALRDCHMMTAHFASMLFPTHLTYNAKTIFLEAGSSIRLQRTISLSASIASMISKEYVHI